MTLPEASAAATQARQALTRLEDQWTAVKALGCAMPVEMAKALEDAREDHRKAVAKVRKLMEGAK